MKIAVVGSGVSGLAATWALNEHSPHEVHLYEVEDRAGGHANTISYIPPGKSDKDAVDVDTGFIVFNPTTYPNFLRFLQRIPTIRILQTEMTFSVCRDSGLFEWAGKNVATLFCQPSRLLDPDMWRLVYDVLRFNACARRLVSSKAASDDSDLSIGDYLDREGYSASFRDNYLIPMTAAIWSTPPDKCLMNFPARTLVQFMSNHHLLQVTGKPSWLTIEGGSRKYVDAILSQLPKERLHLSSPVTAICRTTQGGRNTILLKTRNEDAVTLYDRVILACHSDACTAILKGGRDLRDDEEDILKSFTWNKNVAVLHSDINLMPKARTAWSCWNYLTFSSLNDRGGHKANINKVALTYYMNELQHLPEDLHGPVLVTLNPPTDPDVTKTAARFAYDHPILDTKAIIAQKAMPNIQGRGGVLFAGAWLGYGFHEDGFTSGLRAVTEHIDGVQLPFEIAGADREPRAVFIAPFFDFLEVTGIRAIVGTALKLVLLLVKFIVHSYQELCHIQ
ncbi:hypothetical protein DEU56DRAFT_893401 [Suillus clintonianus]|uniref:uncharacterized protein n=1 Tax=Suillus clintonianus TaxID=1904413 RepID=UPI001B866104|nr:uncharacterized protein DEU56DRAFT_893401 [Suillus clintonianus]KAG2123795.1 hypothetical protein DEU56DRAFT_893401 [Suillus clintonianus]